MTDGHEFDLPTEYQIRFKGAFNSSWSDRPEGFSITEEGIETLLVRVVPDQLALHGV